MHGKITTEIKYPSKDTLKASGRETEISFFYRAPGAQFKKRQIWLSWLLCKYDQKQNFVAIGVTVQMI